MKFLSFNIQYSKGRDGKFDLQRTAEAMAGADITGLQEVVRNLPGVPDADQPRALGKLLPQYFSVYGAAIDFDAGSHLVDGAAQSRRMQFGNMLLSKWPILSTRNFTLPWTGLTHDHDMQNCVLEAMIDGPDGLLRVYVTHLNYRRSVIRRQQLEWLVPKLFAVQHEGMGLKGTGFGADIGGNWEGVDIPQTPAAFVVLGDFNLTPQCREYETIVGEDDFHFGRFVVPDRWADSWVLAGHDNEGASTWYDEEAKIGTKLDYGFVSPDLANNVNRAWIDVDCEASDHQPNWFELSD